MLWFMKWMVNGAGDSHKSIYFGWLDRSLVVCVQIRCEQMACLDSVKQRTIRVPYSYHTVQTKNNIILISYCKT